MRSARSEYVVLICTALSALDGPSMVNIELSDQRMPVVDSCARATQSRATAMTTVANKRILVLSALAISADSADGGKRGAGRPFEGCGSKVSSTETVTRDAFFADIFYGETSEKFH
jgi:hypothetical protein